MRARAIRENASGRMEAGRSAMVGREEEGCRLMKGPRRRQTKWQRGGRECRIREKGEGGFISRQSGGDARVTHLTRTGRANPKGEDARLNVERCGLCTGTKIIFKIIIKKYFCVVIFHYKFFLTLF